MRKQISYKLRILLIVGTSIFIAFLVGINISYKVLTKNIDKEFKSRINLICTNFADKIYEQVIIEDEEGLRRNLLGLKQNKEIVYAGIYNKHNKLVLSISDIKNINPTINNNQVLREVYTSDETRYYEIVRFVQDKNHKKEGSVRLIFSISPIKSAQRNILNIIIIYTIPFFILSIIISIYLGYILSKPLNSILTAIKKVSNKDYKQTIPKSKIREINQLIDSFNKMNRIIHLNFIDLDNEIKNRKEKEKDLKILNKDLSSITETLKKQNIELEKAKTEAEESDKLKTTFLNNISHEIRTPMNAIKGFSLLLKEKNISNDEKLHYIDIINDSSDFLLQLITDIIDYSKLSSGTDSPFVTTINTNELLQELFSIFNSEISKNKEKTALTLKLKKARENFIIKTDKAKLMQIFKNLIENAIKFTNSGYVEFGYKEVDNGEITFFVTDTGPGIKKEHFDDIFSRFYKVTEHEHKFHRGTGLGLSIVKECIQVLNGKIWLESEINKGTSFFFKIKITESGDSHTEKTNAPEKICFNGEKILIAEDDELNFLFLKEVLSEYNLQISRVTTGEDAINFAMKEKELKLILMDIKMPKTNGIAAVKKIRDLKINIPIIMQTAYTNNSEKSTCFEYGADGYLTKPIDKAILMNKIDHLLNGHCV